MKTKTRNPTIIIGEIYESIPKEGEISTESLKEKVKNQGGSYTTLYKYLEKLLNWKIIEKRNEGKKVFYKRAVTESQDHTQLFEALKNQKKLTKNEKNLLKETIKEFNLFVKVFTEIVWNECRSKNNSKQAKEAVRNRVTTVYGFMYPLIEKCYEANKHTLKNGFTILDIALSEIDKKLEFEPKPSFG